MQVKEARNVHSLTVEFKSSQPFWFVSMSMFECVSLIDKELQKEAHGFHPTAVKKQKKIKKKMRVRAQKIMLTVKEIRSSFG